MRINEVVVTCACCGKKSVQKTVSECVAKGKMELDTRPPEEKRSALEYEVQECPECHYCSEDISSPIKNCGKDELNSDTYKNILEDGDTDNIARKFLLAGYLYQQAGDSRRAGLQMLRMAWRFDDLGDSSAAKDAREMAIAFYKEANEEEYDDATALLIADLLRRTGNFWDATMALEAAYHRSQDSLIISLLSYEKRLIVHRDTSAHDIGGGFDYVS